MDELELRKYTRKNIIVQRLEFLSNEELNAMLDGLSQESLFTLQRLFPEAVIFDHLIQLKNM